MGICLCGISDKLSGCQSGSAASDRTAIWSSIEFDWVSVAHAAVSIIAWVGNNMIGRHRRTGPNFISERRKIFLRNFVSDAFSGFFVHRRN